MVRKSRHNVLPPPREPVLLLVSREEAADKIQKQINEGEELLGTHPGNEAELDTFREKEGVWSDYNTQLLKTLFNTAEIAEEYAALTGGSFSMNPSFGELVQYVYDDVQTSLTRLRSIYRRLELFPTTRAAASERSVRPANERGTDIFLVHGHDNEAKETVARFLERLQLSVIILHEQPNLGRTIIEKFVDYANVGYAVILLTADDVGAANDQADCLQPRSRQNVILELGYFLGALGRTHVCALKADGVEEPSDLSGVLYVPLDAGGSWKLKLASEIKATGIKVDMNLAI